MKKPSGSTREPGWRRARARRAAPRAGRRARATDGLRNPTAKRSRRRLLWMKPIGFTSITRLSSVPGTLDALNDGRIQ